MSLHQTGFQEVLACAALAGRLPRHLALVGVQPHTLEDFGGSLTDVVKGQIEPALVMGLDWLARLGVQARPRPQEPGAEDILGADALGLADYEAGRPDADAAPRHGDPRVLVDPSVRFDPKPMCADGTSMHVGLDHRGGR
jgi:hydrogenase maturation protease